MARENNNNYRRSNRHRNSKTEDLKWMLEEHSRVIMPTILVAALLLTIGIGLLWNRSSANPDIEVTTAGTEEEQVLLEVNAYPEVNALFEQYYEALAEGNTQQIEILSSELSEEEKIRIAEIAKYIDSYTQIDVYTKPGPVENSYVAYVYTTMKFAGYDWEVPGMQTMYVCTNSKGDLYINNQKTQDKAVSNYIQTVSLDDDVVDLSNKTTAQYNELVGSDSALSAYLNELSSNIDLSVGQQLGELQKSQSDEVEEGDETAVADETADTEDSANTTEEEVTG